MQVISPTHVIPGLSAVKSRLIRSGRRSGLEAGTVVRTFARGWTALQAQSPHEETDRVPVGLNAPPLQGDVDPSVPVSAVGIVEDPLDQSAEFLPASLGF